MKQMALAVLLMPLLFACSGGSSTDTNLYGSLPEKYEKFMQEKADQKKQKHKSGENSSDDQREIAFLFHNENPFLCRGRLPTTFRSRELMIESSRQSFTRIRGSILPYSRSTTKLMIIMRAAISTRMP